MVPAQVRGGKWGKRVLFATFAVTLFALLWFVHPIAALIEAMLVLLVLYVGGDVRTYQALRKQEETRQLSTTGKASFWFAIAVIVLGIYHVVQMLYAG